MLESVRFRNYKSFAKETIIDLKPGRIEYLSDTNINDGVLKGVAFYGANASGKTNALYAITLLLDLLFKNNIGLTESYSLFSKEAKMWFEYAFRFDAHRLVYSFEITKNKGITKETLSEEGKTLLDRTMTSAKSYITENQDYDEIDPNSLFIRSIYFNTRFAGQPTLLEWINYLKNSIFYNPIRTYAQLITFSNKNNEEVYLESYLAKHGTGEINDFLAEFHFPFRIEYTSKQDLLGGAMPMQMRLKTVREGLSPIPFYMESAGSQILLSFLPAFLTVVKQGGILAIDEFSSGLHNDLEELLVSYFYRHSHKAQLFFVSHSTNLLKTSLLRPDQVYSAELDQTGSYLVKFSEHGMRESQNMEKMYLAGALGGIPTYEGPHHSE